MPRTTFPRDRFDDLAGDDGRIGAHRAENPRLRGGVVFLWAAITTIILVIAGIFATLIVTDRIALFPEPVPTQEPLPTVTPIVDTSFSVLVLNATPQGGMATQVKEVIVAAGWSPDAVAAGEAGAADFPLTTVYYALPEHASAAAGLADVIGGAQIVQDARYQPVDDPNARQLTVVLGLDRISAPSATPAT